MATNVTNEAKDNLISAEDIRAARLIDFVSKFTENIKKLTEIMGVMNLIPKQAGVMLNRHKVTGTLEDGDVPEGEIIPLSHYASEDVPVGVIKLKKWAKSTSAEAIIEKGYEKAVEETTEKMKRDIQKTIRADIIESLEIEGQPEAAGTNTQAALANAWGKLQTIFEDTAVETVYFVNPMDIADYLGNANITVQSAFGFSYVENFLGLGTVIMISDVPAKTFFATAKENMVGYYVSAKDGDLAKVFDFASDETGFIAMNERPDYERLTADDTMMSGIRIFADNEAGVVKGSIG